MAFITSALVMAVVFAAIGGGVTLALHLAGSAAGNGVPVGGFTAARPPAGLPPESVEQVAAKVVPSVVTLRTVRKTTTNWVPASS